MRKFLFAVFASSLVSACSGSGNPGAPSDAAVAQDSTAPGDGSTPARDAAGTVDAPVDAGEDSAYLDAGVDVGNPVDAAPDADAAPPEDAGNDAPFDAGTFDCGTPPVLHPSAADAGPFCPFSTAAPPFSTCGFGQHCCEPPAGTGNLATCASDCAGLVDGGIDWECQDPVSCPTGELCCANTTSVGPGECSYPFLSGFTGTVCAASCGAGQARICQSDVECPTPTTCTATKSNGAVLGICQ